MKKVLYFYSTLLLVIFFSVQINAQVTNLVVIGASPGGHFTLESGGELVWSFNVPNNGDTSLVQIWLDINKNGSIDSGDKIFQQFNQIDGDAQGIGGIPDVDGVADGSVNLSNFLVGSAPADYIFKMTNKGIGQEVAGTITPLSIVAFTISGKVTVPAGTDPSNIFVELARDNIMPEFWDAITDAQGNYTIKMTSDTAGNPWNLELINGQLGSSIITPKSYKVTVDGNKTNMNFSVSNSNAKVVGILKKEDGSPVPFSSVSLSSMNGQIQIQHFADTDLNGLFQIGLLVSELNGQQWNLQGWLRSADTTETYMDADVRLSPINVSDSVYKDLTLYVADATITGNITFSALTKTNGNLPQITIDAFTDSTQSLIHNDTTTGNYILRVSSKIAAYTISEFNLPSGYDPITLFNIAPGATNVNLNFVLTGVKERTSGIPELYILSQNYPNPFNPTTNINYDIPKSSFVNITVYNELGQQVITLVNKNQKAGKYVVSFNAKGLSSGVYFLKIKANDFAQTKKMILLK